MAIEPKIIQARKADGQKPISTMKRRRTREQKGQAARRASMRLSHQHFGERQQILTSQAVQRKRALNELAVQRQLQTQRTGVFRRTVVNSATSSQPVGQQQGQGVGGFGIVLRIFIAIVVFSMLYLVLTNAGQTSGIIKTFGQGLVGLSSDKTLFVRKTA